jgi:tetratricopeptide (TPR) repeat protein
LIGQALAGNRPAPVRTALRVRAGEVLAVAGASVERVARYLVEGSASYRAPVGWLVRSAEALTVLAPELAVRLLRRALADAAEDDTAGVLRFQLVRALLWAGELVEAEHAAAAALATAPEREGTLRWLLAQARYRQGRLDDASTAAEDALGSPRLTPAEAGRFHGFASICFLLLERFAEAEAAAGKALDAAEATGDGTAAVYGRTTLAARHCVLGDPERALSFSEQAIAVLEVGLQPGLEIDPYVIHGKCLIHLDRLDEADRVLAMSIEHNRRAGGVHLPSIYYFRAWLRFVEGRWDDACAETTAGLKLPDPYHFAPALRSLEGLVAIHRGTHTPDAGAGGAPDPGLGGGVLGHVMLWEQALAAEARANPRQALALLYPAWERPAGLQPRRGIYEICPDLARLAAAEGDRGRSGELAATTQALATRAPSPSMNATALLCRGLADGEPAPLLDAARLFHQARRPLHEGYSYEHAAALLAERRRTAEARGALDRALTLYAGLGAVWDTTRAETRLDRGPASTGAAPPAASRVDGPA